MRHISVAEADHSLSTWIADVEAGEHVVIERQGIPVAEIIPFRRPINEESREEELQKFFALLKKGLPLGGGPAPSKDEMHER